MDSTILYQIYIESTAYLHPYESIAFLTVIDITTIPIPLPATVSISTNSRFFLKYCPIIRIEQSLVIPIPSPKTKPIIIYQMNENRVQNTTR